MEAYFEKMMEQLNSEESMIIFRNISRTVLIGLTTTGRKAWQEEEETRNDTSIVLIHQEKKFFVSELFKAIQDAVSLILLYRTMLLFRRLLPVYLSCRICNQFTFHHQFGIDTWMSKFEQQTDSILSACGSHGQ